MKIKNIYIAIISTILGLTPYTIATAQVQASNAQALLIEAPHATIVCDIYSSK